MENYEKIIYLAHPITSKKSYITPLDEYRIEKLKDKIKIECRYINIIDPETYNLDDEKDYNEIVKRNMNDIKESFIMVADCVIPSNGVGMEMFFANLHKKCIISWVTIDRPVSAWITKVSDFICPTTDEIIQRINEILYMARNDDRT